MKQLLIILLLLLAVRVGATIYVTASPCWGCFRLIANAGIGRIAFGEFYRDQRVFDVATRLGIELVDMSGSAKQS